MVWHGSVVWLCPSKQASSLASMAGSRTAGFISLKTQSRYEENALAVKACGDDPQVTDLGAVLHMVGGTAASYMIFFLPGLLLVNAAIVKHSASHSNLAEAAVREYPISLPNTPFCWHCFTCVPVILAPAPA